VVLNLRQNKVEKVLKSPDAVIGWEPVPEPIKDPDFPTCNKTMMMKRTSFRPEF
jgi:hypothetical protein